jgi:hypothetical protein
MSQVDGSVAVLVQGGMDQLLREGGPHWSWWNGSASRTHSTLDSSDQLDKLTAHSLPSTPTVTVVGFGLVRIRSGVSKKPHELPRLADEKSVRSESLDYSHRSPLVSVGRTIEQTGKLRLSSESFNVF